MKKTNNIFKIIIILIIAVVAIFIANTFRKAFIINKYNLADENNKKQSNIYMKKTSDANTTEVWIKGNKSASKETSSIGTQTLYVEDEQNYAWIITDDTQMGKSATKVSEFEIPGVGTSEFSNSNFFELLKYAIFSKIKTTEENGIKCYEIKNKDTITYVDKENYITVRIINGDKDYLYEFEINNVEDESVRKPNLTGYEILDYTESE